MINKFKNHISASNAYQIRSKALAHSFGHKNVRKTFVLFKNASMSSSREFMNISRRHSWTTFHAGIHEQRFTQAIMNNVSRRHSWTTFLAGIHERFTQAFMNNVSQVLVNNVSRRHSWTTFQLLMNVSRRHSWTTFHRYSWTTFHAGIHDITLLAGVHERHSTQVLINNVPRRCLWTTFLAGIHENVSRRRSRKHST